MISDNIIKSFSVKDFLLSALPWLAILIGLLGLSGWIFGIPILRNFLSDSTSMKVNTALILVLGGSAMQAVVKNRTTMAQILLWFMVILSLSLVLENLFGWNFHIDELLFKDSYTNKSVESPGRTSLLTALNALFAATAMLLLTRKHYRIAQLLAGAIFLIVYVSLMGHLFHISGFYSLGHYSGIAFHTALGLLCIAAAILAYQPQQGWLGPFYRQFKRKNLFIYLLSYGLGAAPLFAAIYFFIIAHGGLSPASDVIILVALTTLLSVPVGYFMLRVLNKMESDLSRTGQRLQIALDAGKFGSYDLDLVTGIMVSSDQCKRNFGLPPDAVLNFPELIAAIAPAHREKMQKKVEQAIQMKTVYNDEYQIEWPDGSFHWIRASGKAEYNADERALSISGVTYDITLNKDYEQRLQQVNEELGATNEELGASNEELATTNEELLETQTSLHQLVQQLQKSENRFRTLIRDAPVAISVLSGKDMIVESANELLLKLIGKDYAQIIGKPYRESIPELAGQPFWNLLDKVYETGETYFGNEAKATLEKKGQLTDGYYNFTYQPLKDERGGTYGIMIVATEVTDLVKARMEREKAEEMLRLAVEGAHIGSWYIDPQDRTLQYNATLAQIFGYEGHLPMTYEMAIGQITEEFRPKIIAELERASSDGTSYDITFDLHRFNDSTIIWLRSLGKVSRDENGITSFSGVVMDITEQKKDDLRKNDFIGMVSHELKTPLTSLGAIIQVANLKLKDSPDPFLPGAMGKAEIQVRKMNNMINGFLNISRLESGKLEIKKQKFLLNELIQEMIDDSNLIAPGQEIILEPCVPLLVSADRDKIGSVISNLLSNAIKYSPKGKLITISCSFTDSWVTLSIQDEGMGIDEKDLDKLFDRYYRVENANMKHIAGFGIGLYLSAEIIRHHSGKIWVESKLGEGATFVFSLPANEIINPVNSTDN